MKLAVHSGPRGPRIFYLYVYFGCRSPSYVNLLNISRTMRTTSSFSSDSRLLQISLSRTNRGPIADHCQRAASRPSLTMATRWPYTRLCQPLAAAAVIGTGWRFRRLSGQWWPLAIVRPRCPLIDEPAATTGALEVLALGKLSRGRRAHRGRVSGSTSSAWLYPSPVGNPPSVRAISTRYVPNAAFHACSYVCPWAMLAVRHNHTERKRGQHRSTPHIQLALSSETTPSLARGCVATSPYDLGLPFQRACTLCE